MSYNKNDPWLRKGRGKCDICGRICPHQHEVGLGYWCCDRKQCQNIAERLYTLDNIQWHAAKALIKYSQKVTPKKG
jgi:hypothetical protein